MSTMDEAEVAAARAQFSELSRRATAAGAQSLKRYLTFRWTSAKRFRIEERAALNERKSLMQSCAESLGGRREARRLIKWPAIRAMYRQDRDARPSWAETRRSLAVTTANHTTFRHMRQRGIVHWVFVASPTCCDACTAENGEVYRLFDKDKSLPRHDGCDCTMAPWNGTPTEIRVRVETPDAPAP